MTRAQLAVFVRYALMAIGGWLVGNGIMSEPFALEMARDPELIEAITGLLMWCATGVWYWVSESRKALAERMAAK